MLPAARSGPCFNVLVVEDNDDLRDLIAENLRELGHEPVPARDRATAMQTFAERPIDVLLSHRHGVAGWLRYRARVCHCRADPCGANHHLVRDGSALDGTRIGSAIRPDVLTLPKPFDIEQLREVLAKAQAQLNR